MLRKALLGLGICTILAWPALAIDVVWDGGDGNWDDANWNGGEDLIFLVGEIDGADGWNSQINVGEMENIIIGGGATVTYDADVLSADFEMRQGSTLTIKEGARWLQETTEDWLENRWTEMDLSRLLLDGGTFSRIGEGPGDGGGALIFGSWQGDDTFDSEFDPLGYQDIRIDIINGGRLENVGELWFGSWEDLPLGGTTIIMTINDGTVDLTGGDTTGSSPTGLGADLVFSNKYGDDEIDKPTYAINFTGPGSITVDETGILNQYVDEFGDWQNADPVTYESLWDAGILQADGMSGVDGADFSSFFTVTGSLGGDDYTLTRATLEGDFNGNGEIDAGDLDVHAQYIKDQDPAGDVNSDGNVNVDDRAEWVSRIQGSFLGDSNFDSEFNSGDLVAVFTAGKYENGEMSIYAEGDWDGDMLFTSGDLVAAFTVGGYEMGPPQQAANAVPEPSSLVLVSLAALALVLGRRSLPLSLR